MKRFPVALAAWVGLISTSPPPQVDEALLLAETPPAKLSAFNLFLGPQTPNRGVEPYHLQTPLFSDYAEKFRFIYVPEGQSIGWRKDGILDFPVGSVLIKSFGYPADMRAPDKHVRILETRLLIRRAGGWVALPYVWDADGRDATLKKAGMRIDVSWVHLDGKPRAISYAVPNVNQCKGCHDNGGVLTPIGPRARNLAPSAFPWAMVKGAPAAHALIPDWNNPASGTNAERARAYLDVNCGHCHNRAGPANTSGLWLDWDQAADVNLGIGKRPTAAGRGSGDREFAIAPGKPDQSYLIYRMQSLDPGIAMPELGRATVHDEGIAVLSRWIMEMK